MENTKMLDSSLYSGNGGGRILTYTGKMFCTINPDPRDIDIQDIAHASANICRFNGHTREFYSLSQHACRVHDCMPPAYRLPALLHDASEAYISDLARPIKENPGFESYRNVEAKLEQCINDYFDIPWPMSDTVKEWDNNMVVAEGLEFFENPEWAHKIYNQKPFSIPTSLSPYQYWRPWAPSEAKQNFLERFEAAINEWQTYRDQVWKDSELAAIKRKEQK